MSSFAEQVAGELAAVPGVAAVTLGGWAGDGTADGAAAVDFRLYYHSNARPALKALRLVAAALDPTGGATAVSDYGAWGPWLDGGGRLLVQSRRVEWSYRDIDWVASAIGYCRAGLVRIHHLPGHPYGFHDHAYAAEVALGRVLHDPEGELAALRGLVADYPAAMGEAIVDQGLSDALLTLETASRAANAAPVANAASPAADAAAEDRGDVLSVTGAAFRVVASLVQVLHAINGRWLVLEEGSLRSVGALSAAPPDFVDTAEALLSATGRTAVELRATLDGLGGLVTAVAQLADGDEILKVYGV